LPAISSILNLKELATNIPYRRAKDCAHLTWSVGCFMVFLNLVLSVDTVS
jgi:hypothetical protein